MTESRPIKKFFLIGSLTIVVALAAGYGISVYLGKAELGLDHALVFFTYAMITIVPLLLVLGALPLLVSVFALKKKKNQTSERQGD